MTILPENWDTHQKDLNASILQSRVWAEVQKNLGRNIYFGSSENWSWLGYENNIRGFRYLMIPYGPTIAQESDLNECILSIMSTAKKQGLDFVRFEPMGEVQKEKLRSAGAIKVESINPMHTHVIDVSVSEEELRRALGSSLRNLINGTERRGIKIVQSNKEEDLRETLEMLDETASRAKVKFHSHDYLKNIWDVMREDGTIKLYIAYYENQAVAGALFYDYNGIRYYAHAGAKQELNRKLNASSSLLWQAIIDAKELGLKYFDMWGVAPDEDPKHKWAGISAFKRSFGGATVNYLGTYDIPIKKIKYKLYKSLKSIKGNK